ncbi:MAG: GH92 family glycosyl hydrolase [Rikenellaceae bacterium]
MRGSKIIISAVIIFIAGLLLFLVLSTNHKSKESERDYVSLVYPQLDTENSRWFFFSSASRPFGMVNLSPDTEVNGAWKSGYSYSTTEVKGFSHVHAWQLSALSTMPVSIGTDGDIAAIYGDFYSNFSHDTEVVMPGYHKLHLDRYDVDVELTSTKRVGFHKYTYNRGGAAIMLNLNGMLGPAPNIDGRINSSSNRSISGQLNCKETGRRPRPTTIYFELNFDADIQSIERDPQTGNYIVLFGEDVPQVMMKAAISYTSNKNARLNLESELAGWNFEATVDESQREWNSMLSRIKIKTDDTQAKRRFYTDLWHALQGRRVISDVNGCYPDNTGEEFRIGQIPLNECGKPKFNQYNSDSFWGAQWTITTLWQLVYPEIAEEFVNSMLTYYKDGGMIPRGPSGGNYTFVMTGASSTPFIVAAYQKGIRGYDVDMAYEALRKNHLPGGIMERAGYEHFTNGGGGLDDYIERGYIPHPNVRKNSNGLHRNGANQTLEYAFQDWTLAQMAKAMEREEDYEMFMARSLNYRNIYDSQIGWMRPRGVDGEWYDEEFDPYALNNGFTESNSAQSTWFVPHDISGLATLMGGAEEAVERLNRQFEQASKLNFTSGTSHAQETHPEYSRIPINYGNQPSIQTAFIFNHLGAPHLTQYWSRAVAEVVFSGLDTSVGYCGDEDQGLMGSLAVLYKIGLFQMNGGCDVEPYYELGSPMFDRVTIELNPKYYSGEQFVIETQNNSSKRRYIKRAMIDGEELEGYRIAHRDVVDGGQLTLEMYKKI